MIIKNGSTISVTSDINVWIKQSPTYNIQILQTANQIITVNCNETNYTSDFLAEEGTPYTANVESTNASYTSGTLNYPLSGTINQNMIFKATPAIRNVNIDTILVGCSHANDSSLYIDDTDYPYIDSINNIKKKENSVVNTTYSAIVDGKNNLVTSAAILPRKDYIVLTFNVIGGDISFFDYFADYCVDSTLSSGYLIAINTLDDSNVIYESGQIKKFTIFEKLVNGSTKKLKYGLGCLTPGKSITDIKINKTTNAIHRAVRIPEYNYDFGTLTKDSEIVVTIN